MTRLPHPRTEHVSLVEAPDPFSDRIRIALHDLATARKPGQSPGYRQQTEDTVVCLLLAPALAEANTACLGRLTPAELVRVTSAVLTAAVRAGDPAHAQDFVPQIIRLVARRVATGSGIVERTSVVSARPERRSELQRRPAPPAAIAASF